MSAAPTVSGGATAAGATPTGASPLPTTSQAGPSSRTVQIFLSTEADCGDVRPVDRQISDTEAVATAALHELFSGRVTEAERAAGLRGFGPETAGLLRRLRIADGTAYVDLDASYRSAIDSAGTSCGGAAFHSMIASTLRQFPTVKNVRYAFDGNPREFVEFTQGACPEGTIPPGDPCDPRPWGVGGDG